jgi:UDP-N-acetylglucosamine acyltransferase
MNINIHPTAKSCQIGPYCVIGGNVKLEENVVLKSHVVIEGDTTIGSNTIIFPFTSIGSMPQDKKYAGENSKLIIGSNNVIREYCNINPGTMGGGMLTKIGNNCLLMVGTHIAHDCSVGDNVILANHVTLAGHVQVGDYTIIGGLSAVHQFVRIGEEAMVGGMSGIERDIIPYGLAVGNRAKLTGLNLVGLKRKGYSKESINDLREVYEKIFDESSELLFADRLKQALQKYSHSEEVVKLINFIQYDASRTVCKPE